MLDKYIKPNLAEKISKLFNIVNIYNLKTCKRICADLAEGKSRGPEPSP